MEYMVIDLDEFRDLLKDATVAADPRSGGLLDYRDLQQLLARVAAEASSLLEEHESLECRLTRSARNAIGQGKRGSRQWLGSDQSFNSIH